MRPQGNHTTMPLGQQPGQRAENSRNGTASRVLRAPKTPHQAERTNSSTEAMTAEGARVPPRAAHACSTADSTATAVGLPAGASPPTPSLSCDHHSQKARPVGGASRTSPPRPHTHPLAGAKRWLGRAQQTPTPRRNGSARTIVARPMCARRLRGDMRLAKPWPGARRICSPRRRRHRRPPTCRPARSEPPAAP